MQIKTLADILAENNIKAKDVNKGDNSQQSEALSADFFKETHPTPKMPKKHGQKKKSLYKKNKTHKKAYNSRQHKQNKPSHNASIATSNAQPTTEPAKTLDIKSILQEIKNDDVSNHAHSANHNQLDNLTQKLQNELKTPEQRQSEINEIKSNSRLRWLAFYYLSVREHSASELKTKLLAKNQDPDKIDALLAEFAEKGYQSEMRTALMLIRASIRKGRGRRRIEQDFFERKLAVPNNIDELIDMANAESDEFADFIDNSGTDKVDWLSLAVEARVKKYGNHIPMAQKEKAKQLRFLQYRGFKTDICFEALKYNLDTLEK